MWNRVRRALENTAQLVRIGADASFTYGQGLLQAGVDHHLLLTKTAALSHLFTCFQTYNNQGNRLCCINSALSRWHLDAPDS